MSVTRRCFLKFTCGAAVGTLFSPLPWKLLDDAAIWTQNGTWIAQTPRGPVSSRFTTCTLCAAGCGLRLRRVGDDTVSVQGLPGHPAGGGFPCPAGLGLAQLAHHPARLRSAVRRDRTDGAVWHPVETATAVGEVARKLAELRASGNADRIAILDLRPGRSLSTVYRTFLASAGGGRYLTLPDGREQAADAFSELVDLPGRSPGLDFERTDAVISFGAPLIAGWDGAGPARGLIPRFDPPGQAPRPFLIQAQSNGSVDSDVADVWLPLRPGTEVALALGLTHLALRKGPGRPAREPWPGFADLVARHTPVFVERVTGIHPARLMDVARDLDRRGPVIAVGGGAPGTGPLGRPEELAIWALNLTLGNLDRPGGVTLRHDLPWSGEAAVPTAAESLRDIPDGSLDLLLVDGSLPQTPVAAGLLRRKMRSPSALIVGLSPFGVGPVAGADLVIPTTAPGEWLDDVPPRALASRSVYALSPAVDRPARWALHPARALEILAAEAGFPRPEACGEARHHEILRQRLESLFAQGRGRLAAADGHARTDLGRVASVRKFEQALLAGDCWIDDPDPGPPPPSIPLTGGTAGMAAAVAAVADGRLAARPAVTAEAPLTLMVSGHDTAANGGALPPVVNKLYRESGLRSAPGDARLNPATARQHGWRTGRRLVLETDRGRWPVTLKLDESVQPGVVLVPAGPGPASLGDPADPRTDIINICSDTDDAVWRVGRAALREV